MTSPTNTINDLITCNVCNSIFRSNRAFAAHYQSHPTQANLHRVDRLLNESFTSSNPSPPQENVNEQLPVSIQNESNRFLRGFRHIELNEGVIDNNAFEQQVAEFVCFIGKAKDSLPNKPPCPSKPIHPNTRMYEMRKERKRLRDLRNSINLTPLDATLPLSGYKRSTNPARTAKKARESRQHKYEYELCQYNFSFQRKHAARMAMNFDRNIKCEIPIGTLQAHFDLSLGIMNSLTLENYPVCRTQAQNIIITLIEVKKALDNMNPNTTATRDSITVVVIKALRLHATIASITNIMLKVSYVPKCLSNATTSLLVKDIDSDLKNIGSWRPITMFSVLRRVIGKCLEFHIRKQIDLCPNQREFMLGQPGTYLDAGHVDGYLKHAKHNKKDLVLVFFDISKAFDSIGHEHILRCLESQGVAINLRYLVGSLIGDNTIQIKTMKELSKPIRVKRSVPQGAPTSPILFNMSINHIYTELTQPTYANIHGYHISDDLPPATILGFADDQVLVGNSTDAARQMVELVTMLFNRIGLKVNPNKSQVINIKNGTLSISDLKLNDGSVIQSIKSNKDKVKYLGCSFSDEIKFDNNIIVKITDQLNSLPSSPLLKKHQKLIIIEQFILPQLTYHLQAAALNRILSQSIQVLDTNIRTTVKAILGLPTSSSTDMMYAPKKLRRLGVIKIADEVHLQAFLLAQKLKNIHDATFHYLHNCERIIADGKEVLNIVDIESVKKMRKTLRHRHTLR